MTIEMLLSRLLAVTEEPPVSDNDADHVLEAVAKVSEERQPLIEELKRRMDNKPKLTTTEHSMLTELQLRDARWSALLQRLRGSLAERIRSV